MVRNPNVVDYDVITVADTANDIISLGALTALPTSAKSFTGVLETAGIRARGDGTDPTASEGVLISPGAVIYLSSSDIANMKFIRDTSTSGVIRGHYYDVEVGPLIGKGGA